MPPTICNPHQKENLVFSADTKSMPTETPDVSYYIAKHFQLSHDLNQLVAERIRATSIDFRLAYTKICAHAAMQLVDCDQEMQKALGTEPMNRNGCIENIMVWALTTYEVPKGYEDGDNWEYPIRRPRSSH